MARNTTIQADAHAPGTSENLVVTAGVVTAAVGLGTALGLPDDVAVSITGLFGAISALIARSLVTPGAKPPPPA